MTNKKYTQEFRYSIVQLAFNSDKSILQINVDFGANSKQFIIGLEST